MKVIATPTEAGRAYQVIESTPEEEAALVAASDPAAWINSHAGDVEVLDKNELRPDQREGAWEPDADQSMYDELRRRQSEDRERNQP